MPSEADILAFLAQSPGHAGKRDVARAFGITGQAKIVLKQILKDLDRRGLVDRRAKPGKASTALPPICLAVVDGIDEDGETFGHPLEWNEDLHGPLPELHIVAAAAGSRPPGVGDQVVVRLESATGRSSRYRFLGRVMRAARPDAPRIVGIFRKGSGSGGRIIPAGRKERDEITVQRGDENGAGDGELVAAEITRHRGRGLAQARVRERLGKAEDPRNFSLIAIHTHGIPDAMPERIENELKSLAPIAIAGREDLRHIPFITIDPADARDHDDAIWAAPDDDPANPGGHRVLVAIADVAAYVQPGSALDREARKRGNSVYFPDRVVPMLPERLSNDLCSLKEHEARPVLVCHMQFDAQGHKRKHRFTRAMIRVAAGLAYEEAQAAINGQGSAHARLLLNTTLHPLWAAYGAMTQAREKRGPLEIDLPERKIVLDDHGHVSRVITPERLDAHRLVEEFMIQANVAAAEQLISKRTPLLFRVHEEPSAEKIRALSEFLRTVNIPLALGQVMRSKHFNQVLAAAKGTPHERIVHEVVLRSQAQARYHPQNEGHFGLSLANYAHFTSPIRRYADLIVHRALIAALGLGPDGLSAADITSLEETADLISAAERRAMLAERETTDRLIAAYLADHLGTSFEGRVSGVVGAGLFITLAQTGADGFVPVASLGNEYFNHDPVRHALVGAATGETFQLGDAVTVRLMEVTPIKGGMCFEVTSHGKAGTAMPRHGRLRPPKAKGRRTKNRK